MTDDREPVEATIEQAWRAVSAVERAFAEGEINLEAWHRRMAELVVPAYLAATNPRAQSGFGGDEAAWRQARSIVADAIPRSGTFLDVGCANGFLMECVQAWCAEQGREVAPYGLEIAPELAALARARLPHWAHRIVVGNAATWIPATRFDFVRTGLEVVPRSLRLALVRHLLSRVVKEEGRLLIGPYSEERDAKRTGPSLEDELVAWRFVITSRHERPHLKDDRVIRRLICLDV